jgi:hypothetical protein
MAYCPHCAGVLDSGAVVFPHCGYDFPPSNPNPRRGIAYSFLANVALFIGTVAAGFGCLAAVIAVVSGLMKGDLMTALIHGPLTFFICLAMLVVFVRVQRL